MTPEKNFVDDFFKELSENGISPCDALIIAKGVVVKMKELYNNTV